MVIYVVTCIFLTTWFLLEMGFIEPGHSGRLMIMMYRKCIKFIYTKRKFFWGDILMFLLKRRHLQLTIRSHQNSSENIAWHHAVATVARS